MLSGSDSPEQACEATVSVALCIATILDHPAIAAGSSLHDVKAPPNGPNLVRMLERLGDTAHDAGDESVAHPERAQGMRLRHQQPEERVRQRSPRAEQLPTPVDERLTAPVIAIQWPVTCEWP